MKFRSVLGSFWFIHFLVFIGLFSLLGYIFQNQKFLLFFTVLSFAGAICGGFCRVIDEIKANKVNAK